MASLIFSYVITCECYFTPKTLSGKKKKREKKKEKKIKVHGRFRQDLVTIDI